MGEVFNTVVAGVTILVLGQWVTRFLIEPFQALQKIRGEIAWGARFYANVGYIWAADDPRSEYEKGDRVIEASRFWRERASDLDVIRLSLPLYQLWSVLRIVPSRESLVKASSIMVGQSNRVLERPYPGRRDHNGDDRILKLLNLLNIKYRS